MQASVMLLSWRERRKFLFSAKGKGQRKKNKEELKTRVLSRAFYAADSCSKKSTVVS